MAVSPVLAANIAAEIASNEKVRSLAISAFHGLYSRIFDRGNRLVVDALPSAPEPSERELLKQVLASQPSSTEMSVAFAALQGELRRGQQRLLVVVTGLGVLNIALVALLIFK